MGRGEKFSWGNLTWPQKAFTVVGPFLAVAAIGGASGAFEPTDPTQPSDIKNEQEGGWPTNEQTATPSGTEGESPTTTPEAPDAGQPEQYDNSDPRRITTDCYIFNLPDGYINQSEYTNSTNGNTLYSYHYKCTEADTDDASSYLSIHFAAEYEPGYNNDAYQNGDDRLTKEIITIGDVTFEIFTTEPHRSVYLDTVRKTVFVRAPRLFGGEPTIAFDGVFDCPHDEIRTRDINERWFSEDYFDQILDSIIRNLEVRG
jgi:hypothetical protein